MIKDERFNTITHLVGAVLALVGMVVLIVFASLQGNPWKIVSFSIYGTTLFGLYAVSTLYHSIRGRFKYLLQRLDHVAVYLLIAGTYTPITLVTMVGGWGWSIFGLEWFLALLGILQETVFKRRYEIVSIIIYILMGWLILIALSPLLEHLSATGFGWLLAGGVMYTLGIGFYLFDNRVRYFHGIWHLFVLAGSAAHYVTIIYFVL